MAQIFDLSDFFLILDEIVIMSMKRPERANKGFSLCISIIIIDMCFEFIVCLSIIKTIQPLLFQRIQPFIYS